MQVCFRIKNLKASECHGSVVHDFRQKVPRYVDKTKTHLNGIIFGKTPDIARSISEQGERVKSRTGKKLRKDANLFLSGILTFSKDARDRVNSTPPDREALEFARKISEFYKIKTLYAVRHNDETTVHYHLFFENINSDGESVKNKLTPQILSQWQTRAGETFSSIGFSRGTRKSERIARGDDFSKVIHRSVRKLHEDLPKEIEAKEKILSSLKEKIKEEARAELAELPPLPVEEEGEFFVGNSFFKGPETRKVKVFRSRPVKEFIKAAISRLATARVLEKETVPREDFENLRRERDDLSQRVDALERSLQLARQQASNLLASLEKARKFIGWLNEKFPFVISVYKNKQADVDGTAPKAEESVTFKP
jgi:hypothetical protein